ncbi:magnesium and cobalt transporter CorA [Colletotrichum higginsianum]|nr:magnesium and cobalt transporter CorA [Colletotrichum higginsianum]
MSSDSADCFGATMSKTVSEPEDRSRTVRFPSLEIDTHDYATSPTSPTKTRASAAPPATPSTLSPLRRRAGTFKPVEDYGDFDMSRPGWQPGSEPGFDPNKSDGGHASMPTLRADCEISVFDFSQANMVQHKFGNDDFIEFLKKPQEPWVKSRWINVNGLSWDVIQACGQYYKLHKLAIEDIMNTRNRTKADCGYQLNHHTSGLSQLPPTAFRYHASANEVRTEYMETHSSLISRGLAVSAEQVAIFLTSDNTVISFFEMSAEDIERPITIRLGDPSTILRQSCDASLVVQAIIDAIIDLAMPLTAVYSDVIGDLELDVLTSPSIKQTRSLYICVSEINKMLTFLNPIDNLVNVLRDHRTELSQDEAARQLQNPASGVIVTPLTHTYLGDVLDHCVIITESMQQIKRSADNLIDLIFNTISANQNESMKQLTIITIIFLPLTFLTGYFGQNFEDFPEIGNKWGIRFFWIIACPVVFCTILIMMRSWIWSWCVSFWQKRKISAERKKQKKRRARRARRRAKAD